MYSSDLQYQVSQLQASKERKQEITYLLSYLLNYLLIYLLIYSMEQSPSWEANRFSASQEISLILWNPKVHCRIHKCPPTVLIPSQMNLFHVLRSCSFKVRFNTVLHPRLDLPSGLSPLSFPTSSLQVFLFCLMCAAEPVLLNSYDWISRMTFDVQY